MTRPYEDVTTEACTSEAALNVCRRMVAAWNKAACVARHPGRAGGRWALHYWGAPEECAAYYERNAPKVRRGGMVLYIAGPPEQIQITTAPPHRRSMG